MPFTPVNDIMSTVDARRRLRHLRARRRRHLRRLQLLRARRDAAARSPSSSQFTQRHARLQHRLEQPRAERRRRVAAERAERLAARAARRSRAGDAARRLLGRLRAPGHGGLHRPVRRQSRQHAQPDAQRQHGPRRPPGESWPVLLREPNRLYNRAVPGDADASRFLIRPNRADSINAFAPTSRSRPRGRGRSASSARCRTNMAVDVRYVGTRGVNQWSELNYNERERHRERLPRRVPARDGEPAGQQRLRRRDRARLVRVLRPGHRHEPAADLSRLPQRPPRRRQSRRVYRAPNLDEHDARAAASFATNPRSDRNAAERSRRQPDAPRTTRSPPASPANFFVVNPDVNQRQRLRQRRVQRLPRAADRAAPPAVERACRSTAAISTRSKSGSAFLGFRYGRVMNPTGERPPRDQDAVGLDASRSAAAQRFGGNMHPLLNGMLGGWEFNGAGRIQARIVELRQRPAGRHDGERAAEAVQVRRPHRIRRPACGRSYTLPDDVILNTRRAFSISTTSLDGYSSLGAPEGRYFAPANSADCIQLQGGRLRAAHAAGPRAVLHALRHRPDEAVPDPRAT